MSGIQDKVIQAGIWLYSYATDFCVNAANLIGIDYVTFGSIFFGGIMNVVILILMGMNVYISMMKRANKN